MHSEQEIGREADIFVVCNVYTIRNAAVQCARAPVAFHLFIYLFISAKTHVIYTPFA